MTPELRKDAQVRQGCMMTTNRTNALVNDDSHGQGDKAEVGTSEGLMLVRHFSGSRKLLVSLAPNGLRMMLRGWPNAWRKVAFMWHASDSSNAQIDSPECFA